MRQLIHSRDLSFSWLPQSVKSVTVQQLVPSLAPYVACPSQQIIICCWSVLLKHAKSDFCKLFFLKLCIWEKTIGTGPNKNNNLLIQGRYWLPPKPPRVNDFRPKVVNLKAWFWVNPEELQLTSNPLHQSTKSRLDVFPFFHFVEAKIPNHWLNASFVSMT